MERFEPVPYQVVDDPQQLKAFTDPLRVRVLTALTQRAMTNQQLADALSEPQAKVLHHIRVLLDVELIDLVESRIRGGNVEKYYRAVARTFGLMPPPELHNTVVAAEFAALQTEATASATAWPDVPQFIHANTTWLSAEQAYALYQRIIEFLAEQREASPSERSPEADAASWVYGFVLYRSPHAPETASDDAP
jgi:DNA-binding transcriptional ArsR family regulator